LFCPKIANYLHQLKLFNGEGGRIIAHSQIAESKWGLGAEPSTLDAFGINYQNNQVLGMF